MARYKLMRKKNPLNKEKSELWYAIPAPGRQVTTRELCRGATANTTLADIELQMGLELLLKHLPRLLARGEKIQLGRLGSLKLEYGSEGTWAPELFGSHLIRNERIVFRPSRELREAVQQLLSYQIGGIFLPNRWHCRPRHLVRLDKGLPGMAGAATGEKRGQGIDISVNWK